MNSNRCNAINRATESTRLQRFKNFLDIPVLSILMRNLNLQYLRKIIQNIQNKVDCYNTYLKDKIDFFNRASKKHKLA